MFIGILLGAILVSVLLSSYDESQENEDRAELKQVHSNAVLKVETSLNTYVTIVSSIKAFVRNLDEVPKVETLQRYVRDVIKETDFNDSLVVSFLDNDHYFKYVFTPNVLDPEGIVGTRLSKIRPQKNLERLDSLNQSKNEIRLVEPLNLIEGWAALPFSFLVISQQDSVLGYIAVTISSNYLIDYVNKGNENSEFRSSIFLFDSIPLVKNAFLDGTKIYTKEYDNKILKPIINNNTIASFVNLYGYKYKVFTERIEQEVEGLHFKTLIYFWYGSILLIFMVLFFQFNNKVKFKQELLHSNNVISSKNEELKDKLENIRVLSKEVHHRVKNNMQIMSSLLKLQSASLKDEVAKKALFDSNNRIHSMALVHKKLYETDNLKKVNIYEYTNELITGICNSLSEKEVDIKNSINRSFYLDSDKMISIGLILNELVTNSVKYAFLNLEEIAKVEIESANCSNTICITYKDNGNWITSDHKESGGFGLELIQILCNNIDAEYSINRENSEFKITINREE